MAGRPIRMAKKVTALEEKMVEVSELANDYMPDQYNNRTRKDLSEDPLGKAWKDALDKIGDAEDFLGDLGVMLREKADITLEQAKAGIAEAEEEPTRVETAPTGG
ncbi:MAG: hypothetical protein IID54_00395 [Proteobacteria bacterium]|nr:hypothetical protein [Pseudomonadota bacterium]